MRGFLLFLAFAFPVALLSPSFWSLVNMEFAAQRVGYTRADGATQWAMLGPRAPWPAWAVVPEGVDLTVRAHFEPAPGYIESGFADFDAAEPPKVITRRFEDALRKAGWTVKTWRFDAIYPEIPPRPLRSCIVEGEKDVRHQRLSVDLGDEAAIGSLHWTVGPLPPLTGARLEAC